MLADDEIEIGVIGHAVAFVGRPLDLNDAPVRVPAAPRVARHVGEQQEMIDRMPDRSLGEDTVRRQLDGGRVQLDQFLEIRSQRHMAQCLRFLPMIATRLRSAKARRRDTRSLRGVNLRRGCRWSLHGRPSHAAGKAIAPQGWAP